MPVSPVVFCFLIAGVVVSLVFCVAFFIELFFNDPERKTKRKEDEDVTVSEEQDGEEELDLDKMLAQLEEKTKEEEPAEEVKEEAPVEEVQEEVKEEVREPEMVRVDLDEAVTPVEAMALAPKDVTWKNIGKAIVKAAQELSMGAKAFVTLEEKEEVEEKVPEEKLTIQLTPEETAEPKTDLNANQTEEAVPELKDENPTVQAGQNPQEDEWFRMLDEQGLSR